MSVVGIVSITLGVMAVGLRGWLLVDPAATLRWFKGMTGTKGRIRVFGAFALALGATMVWAGGTEAGWLATVLSVGGWVGVVIAALWLVVFPGVYQGTLNAVVPSDLGGKLTGWRLRGLVGVIAGLFLIYFGALAL